jgi:hypothetical protein
MRRSALARLVAFIEILSGKESRTNVAGLL